MSKRHRVIKRLRRENEVARENIQLMDMNHSLMVRDLIRERAGRKDAEMRLNRVLGVAVERDFMINPDVVRVSLTVDTRLAGEFQNIWEVALGKLREELRRKLGR